MLFNNKNTENFKEKLYKCLTFIKLGNIYYISQLYIKRKLKII